MLSATNNHQKFKFTFQLTDQIMKKIRRLGCSLFGNGSQILLKIKLLSVGLLFGFISVAADGYSIKNKSEQVINPCRAAKANQREG